MTCKMILKAPANLMVENVWICMFFIGLDMWLVVIKSEKLEILYGFEKMWV